MRKVLILITLLLLASCSNESSPPDYSGYIGDIANDDKKAILIVWGDITQEEVASEDFERILPKLNEENFMIVYVEDSIEKYKKGQKVNVWAASEPGKDRTVVAKRIEIVE